MPEERQNLAVICHVCGGQIDTDRDVVTAEFSPGIWNPDRLEPLTCPHCGQTNQYLGPEHLLPEGPANRESIDDEFWTMPLANLAEWIGGNAQPGSAVSTRAQAVYSARVGFEVAGIVGSAVEASNEAAGSAASAAESTARATWALVIATILLVVEAVVRLFA